MELIVAVDRMGGIGRDGRLLFSIPEDLRRFKQITMGKTLLMGSRTFLSLPGQKPLPGRRNCVLTRRADELRQAYPPGEFGPFFYDSPEQFFASHVQDDVMVIGGGDVYAQFLPLCNRAFVTEIDAAVNADTFFYLDDSWKCVSREHSVHNDLHFEFCIYER